MKTKAAGRRAATAFGRGRCLLQAQEGSSMMRRLRPGVSALNRFLLGGSLTGVEHVFAGHLRRQEVVVEISRIEMQISDRNSGESFGS